MIKTESRSTNSTRNLIFSVLAYMIQIILGFLGRRFFIYFFSTEYLGLSSIFSNILSILSLADLGFASALVFAMYKPMAEGDDEKVRQLLQYYKKCYLIITCIILCLGLLIVPFMNYFQQKAPNVDANLYVIYILLLANTLVSYLFSYRRSLLYVSQRTDIESKIAMIIKILVNASQLLVIVITKNYYLYIATAGVFTIFDNLLVFGVTKKLFPNLIKKPSQPIDNKTKKEIRKNIFALIFHKFGSVVVFGTDSLLIWALFDANIMGIYSNYLLITSQISMFLAIFTGGVKGSVGNAVASENAEHNYNLFKKLNYLFVAIVAFCSICIFALASPFVLVVLTKNPSTNLLLHWSIVLLVCISFYLTQSRQMITVFKDCNGLFYQNRFAPVVEAVANLVLSLVFAHLIGLAGIVVGTILSTILVPLWVDPYVLNKHYFKKSTSKIIFRQVMYFVSAVLAGGVTFFVATLVPHTTILWLIVKFATVAVAGGVATIVFFLPYKEFKICLMWIRNIIKNFFARRKKTVQPNSK